MRQYVPRAAAAGSGSLAATPGSRTGRRRAETSRGGGGGQARPLRSRSPPAFPGRSFCQATMTSAPWKRPRPMWRSSGSPPPAGPPSSRPRCSAGTPGNCPCGPIPWMCVHVHATRAGVTVPTHPLTLRQTQRRRARGRTAGHRDRHALWQAHGHAHDGGRAHATGDGRAGARRSPGRRPCGLFGAQLAPTRTCAYTRKPPCCAAAASRRIPPHPVITTGRVGARQLGDARATL